MLGTVISNLTAKVTLFLDLWCVKVSLMKSLWNNIIAAGIDRTTLIVQYIKSQLVALKSNIKPYRALFTNQVLLIKVGLLNVLHKVGQVGQQLLLIAHKIRQRVLNLLKQGH